MIRLILAASAALLGAGIHYATDEHSFTALGCGWLSGAFATCAAVLVRTTRRPDAERE